MLAYLPVEMLELCAGANHQWSKGFLKTGFWYFSRPGNVDFTS